MYQMPQRRPRAVLLIDADNFKEETWLEQAKQQLLQVSGQAPVIRAYGAMPSLQSRNGMWGRLAAELVPNLSLEKNTTDASLITDASELCLKEGFRFFAIASGDADFAPLAVRLRRWGCEVWCFGDMRTVFKDADKYYDQVVRCEMPALPVSWPPPLAGDALAVGHTDHSELAVPASIISNGAAERAQCAIAQAAGQKVHAALPQSQAALAKSFRTLVFDASPQLAQGEYVALPALVHTLRMQGLVGKKEKLSAWLAKLGDDIEASPRHQPNQIRWKKGGHSRPAHQAGGSMPAVRDVSGFQQGRCALLAVAPRASVLRGALWEVLYTKVKLVHILAAVPELLDVHQRFTVRSVASRLRDKGLLARAHSLRKICDRYPQAFELNFDVTPQYIRYVG